MAADTEFLQCLGLGLQGLRASGQFCDAMMCVGSTRILVHKVVLSAASKTLHDLALEFDMTPHRERDQLEIIIPPDVALFAVNMFINYIYTGQLSLNERVVSHMERLANIFGVSSLLNHCQEFIQRSSAPDSQNLDLARENQIEPDSSCANGVVPCVQEERLIAGSEEEASLRRNNSACSGLGSDQNVSLGNVTVKSEPADDAAYGGTSRHGQTGSSPNPALQSPQKITQSMSMLEKLMSPVVNIKKLPSSITPDVVVMISDDENDEEENHSKTTTSACSAAPGTSDPTSPYKIKPSHQYTLEEKEAIAIEAKRFGTTHVSNSKNIPLPDILSWMTLFGLRNPGLQKLGKQGKQVNHEADLALVRWIIQQQELSGSVDLNNMKKYALTVYRQTQPKFSASKTWLGNFLQRNMPVLQGTKFVHGEGNQIDLFGNQDLCAVKQELVSVEDMVGTEDDGENVLQTLGEQTVLESVPLTEQMLINQAVEFNNDFDNDDNDNEDSGFAIDNDFSNEYTAQELPIPSNFDQPGQPHGTIQTPFGKRPIIVGTAKCFDAKAERKIVQWVLDRNTQEGYVFTDDFKDFARTLYKGSKPFGATQAWMKKFLRRNRILKDIKFCSKFKNTYEHNEKIAAVACARRLGTGYAAKQTGISLKLIHCWRLAMDRGQLNPSPTETGTSSSVINRLEASTSSVIPPTTSQIGLKSPNEHKLTHNRLNQALHGIVPEFEERIIQEIKDFNGKEGSINYDEISKISQSIYKETRPTFKASYAWIKTFMSRHKDDLKDIEIENISKVLVEDEDSTKSKISNDKISEMVDNALMAIQKQETDSQDELETPDIPGTGKVNKKPVIVGPSVQFTRKTEKLLVEWALERQNRDGYVFTDDFKEFAKSHHTRTKHFSASSGWMSLFLRRHRVLKDVKWKSKFKNNYTEEEKTIAIAEAKRLGTGHVGRKLGIDPALIFSWKLKLEKSNQKQTFWKGTKIRKFGKGMKQPVPKFTPLKMNADDAARGIVPEFEQRIVELILEQHEQDGSTSYEEISKISQSVYKETRANFKASYAWIRNFMKRHEDQLTNLDIDNVKKVFMPEDDEMGGAYGGGMGNDEAHDSQIEKMLLTKRPIIVGQSRSLDTKTEKKLVQWLVEQQEKNGYVFLDLFKQYAQSLYKGEKKFAATQAWRIKFFRRNHHAVKHVKLQSRFKNQYSPGEKKAVVLEARKFGAAYVSKKTGIDHCQINQWTRKMELSGEIPVDNSAPPLTKISNRPTFQSQVQSDKKFGPGLYSVRGVVPTFEKKILTLIQGKMDEEGSVAYQDVSNIGRAVYKETRPNFKACYNWITGFIKRHKKQLRHVEFEESKRVLLDNSGVEILINEDKFDSMETMMQMNEGGKDWNDENDDTRGSWESLPQSEVSVKGEHMIELDNPEDPNYGSSNKAKTGASQFKTSSATKRGLDSITKRPIIIGKSVHFNRKTEKTIVEWMWERQNSEGFVFTDDLRQYARSLYTGPPDKFGATNAWLTKFLRRNKIENKFTFHSRLKGNNPKYDAQIVQLILEHQEKEGSISNEEITRISQDVYHQIRPNFRACYNWVRDFIKRHKTDLKGVEFENAKRVYIPDDEAEDGVLIRDYDPTKDVNLSALTSPGAAEMDYTTGYDGDNSVDSSWMDVDSSSDFDKSRSHTPQQHQQTGGIANSTNSLLQKLASTKRPVIVSRPKTLDIKTEKKIVQYMLEQQEKNGCVYIDLFKDYAKSIHTGPKKFAATQGWVEKFKLRYLKDLKNIVIKSRFRNEYTLEEKIAAVEEARRLGCHHVGRKLGISGSIIYTWKVQMDQGEKMMDGGHGGSSGINEGECARGMVPEFEQSIVDTVLELQRTTGGVSYEDISQAARHVYSETRPNFKASNNWVLEFIRKNKDTFENVNFKNQRKFATEEEKLHILSEEKKYGTEHVVKKRNISSSTLRQWKINMNAKSIPIPKYKALVGSKIKKKYAKGKMKIFTPEEKRAIVAVAEDKGFVYTSLKMGVSRNMISKWVRKLRDQGETIVIKSAHSITGKKELEQKIVDWVLEQNDQLGIVMTYRIQDYAKKVFEEAYTAYNATDYWLEVFISQNGEKFENVRFREKGDNDQDFTDEIKLKLSRYTEKYGAVDAAEKCGVAPKSIYHWRRIMKSKGYDLTTDSPYIPETKTEDSASPSPVNVPKESASSQPRSMMQLKLDKIAQRFNESARRNIVSEANSEGVSAAAAKNKIPLPLLLNWMKMYDVKPRLGSLSSKESTPESLSHTKMKVRLPSIEKAKAVNNFNKYSNEYKRELVEEAKKQGVMETSRRRSIPNSTLYTWMRAMERESSNDNSSERSRSTENSTPSFAISRESLSPVSVKLEPGLSRASPQPGIGLSRASPQQGLGLSRESPQPGLGLSRASPQIHRSLSAENASKPKSSPRKYTEEEKIAVVQRAREIGMKQAARALEVPYSNVKRWTDMYTKKLKTREYSQKKRDQYQEAKLARLSMSSRSEMSESDTDSSMNVGMGSDGKSRVGDGESGMFSSLGVYLDDAEDKDEFVTKQPSVPTVQQQNSRSVERKRKIEEPVSGIDVPKRRKPLLYTDAQKLAFVKQSDELGARAAAVDAGVSCDIIYKWRQKFKGLKSQPSSTVTSAAVYSNNLLLDLNPEESSIKPSTSISSLDIPANSPSDLGLLAPSPSATEAIDSLPSSPPSSPPMPKPRGFHLEPDDLALPLPEPAPSNSSSSDIPVNTLGSLASSVSQLIDLDVDEPSPLNTSPAHLPEISDIGLLGSLAANQILEMTENYMEAEMALDDRILDKQAAVGDGGGGEKAKNVNYMGIQIANIKSESNSSSN